MVGRKFCAALAFRSQNGSAWPRVRQTCFPEATDRGKRMKAAKSVLALVLVMAACVGRHFGAEAAEDLSSATESATLAAATSSATVRERTTITAESDSYISGLTAETDSYPTALELLERAYAEQLARRRAERAEERRKRNLEKLEQRRLEEERKQAEAAVKELQAQREREEQEKQKLEEQERLRRERDTRLIHPGTQTTRVRELLGLPNGIAINHSTGFVLWRYWLSDRTFVVQVAGNVVVATWYEVVPARQIELFNDCGT